MTWTRESVPGSPEVFVMKLNGTERAMFSVIPGPGAHPTALADQVLAGLNQPSISAGKHLECVRQGWTGLTAYDEARFFVKSMVDQYPPSVRESVRQAWSNSNFGDHVLTPDEMAEWYATVDQILDAHRAHESAEREVVAAS